MREIRFRGKTLDGLRWVYGDLIQENSGRVVIRTNLNTWAMNNDVNPYGESLDVIPDTVGQYTGMKDRNGKRYTKETSSVAVMEASMVIRGHLHC